MERRKFRSLLRRTVSIPVVALACLAAILLLEIQSLRKSMDWVDHSERVIACNLDLMKLAIDMETGIRGYLLTNKEEFLQPYTEADQAVEAKFEELSRLVADNPGQEEQLARTHSQFEKWRESAARSITSKRNGNTDGYESILQRKQLMDAVRAENLVFIQAEERLRDERREAEHRTARLVTGGAVLLSLVIGVVLAIVTRREMHALAAQFQRSLELAEQRTEELRASEQRSAHLASFPELNPNPIFETDLKGDVSYVNPAARRVFPGLEKGDAAHPLLQDMGSIIALAGEAAERTLVREVEVAGETFIETIHCSPKLQTIRFYITGITERKRAEQALRASLERLEKVVDVQTVGVMFWDLNTGCMVDANDSFLKLMGYTRNDVEACELTWQKLTPPEYMDVSRAEVEKFLATGRVGPYEKEYFCKDGTRKWLLFAGSSLGGNQCVEFCVDISDRKKMEHALRESEERFRVAQELSPEGFIIFSPVRDEKGLINDFTWVYENAAAEQLNGTKLANVLGRRLLEVFPGNRDTAFFKAYVEVAETGQSRVLEEQYSGDERPISARWFRTAVVRIGTDIAVLVQDITERKRAEERLVGVIAAQRELASANADYVALRQLVLERVSRLLKADGACLEIAEGDEMVYEAGTGLASGFVGLRLKTAGSLSGLSMSSNQLLRSEDTENDPRVDREVCRRIGLRSMVVVPLRYDERMLGVLKLMSAHVGAFTADDEHTLQLMSEFLGVTIARQRALAALQESETRFRTLANAIPQLCWTANADGWITWYNDRWYSYTGATSEQMEGWGWQSVHDPAELPKVMERWQASIATGEPFDMVFPLKGADGEFRPFLTRVMPIKDDAGKVVRWFGTNTDISDQKAIEEELRRSHERLNLALEVARLGEWELDLKTHRASRSERHREIFGVQGSNESWTYQKFIDHVLPEYRAGAMQALKAAQAGGSLDFETQIRRDDGEVRWVWVRGLCRRDDAGDPVWMFGTVMDVTPRKQAEQALRLSEEQYRTTLQSIGDAVISTCAKGKIVFMNEVAERLTGWTLQEANGRPLRSIFNIIQEVTRIRPEDPVEKVIREGKVVGLANHTLLVARDGTERPIDDSAAPIRNEKGELVGVVLVFHDVSDQRKAELALRHNERLATTGRLAATMAHEIHNPLDAVGNLLYLIEQGSNDEQVKTFVSMASGELGRVTQMTRQMLMFQREASKPIPVRLSEILDSVLTLYERKLSTANIAIERRGDHASVILALPGELRQVFANLVGNAIEVARTDGAKIALHTYASQDWRTGRKGVRVTVYDNGPGIPAGISNQIYNPFFTTKGESGTGLGLWIVADIIRKYDGTIRHWTTTKNGCSGTCFSVFLPENMRD